ncbi:MAG: PhnD/SsuA/transferrin family substrate-binding protein, partial [Ardenticatenaceae bacterium]|nr:PhnD/SsuA/transferrin family substrate-binding protein [Ardenticatenaceae bacterium]
VGLFVGLLVGLLAAACQPNIAFVEVTRLVTVDGDVVAVGTAVPIEVTRVVNQEVTRVVPEEVVIEVTKSPIGSEERPVQLLFPPTVNTAVITTRGEPLAQILTETTGQQFAVGIPDDTPTLIDLLCAAPQDTIGVLSALDYARASQQCGAQPGLVAMQPDGLTWQAGMIVTRRDSGLNAVEDLAGRSWGVVDTTSVPEFLAIQVQLADAGVEPGDVVQYETTSSLMLALYNREVDFVTAAYIPPILPYDERPWQYGEDPPEIWRRLGLSPTRSPIGYVIVFGEVEFGGYRLRDDRASIFDTVPGIYDETQILALSPQIPNDTVVFGAAFPLGLAREVTAVLPQFAASEACVNSVCSTDFYGWAGLEPVTDEAYAPLLPLLEAGD